MDRKADVATTGEQPRPTMLPMQATASLAAIQQMQQPAGYVGGC